MEDFFSEPHYRTTTYALSEGSVPFPNITICNMNRADRKKAMALGMTMEHNSSELDPDYLDYFYLSFPEFYLGYHFVNYHVFGEAGVKINMKGLKSKYDAWIIKQNFTHLSAVDLLYKLGLRCEDMLLKCWFATRDRGECCKGAKPVVTTNGLCWLLRTPVTATGAGM